VNDTPNLTGGGPQRDHSRALDPQPAPPSGPLAPFHNRNFRFQWPADLLTSWAFEMETLILGWYVLVETRSVFLLTLFAALQFLGTLIAPMFGVAGDRIGHRNLLCLMRAAYTLLSAVLVAIILIGWLSPFAIFIIAALAGAVRPSDIAVRSSLVAEIVPPNQLVGAMSISRMTSDSARLFGALAGAGLFAALGLTPAYVIVCCLYTLGFAFTLCVKRGQGRRYAQGVVPSSPRPPSPWHDLKEGLVYVWNTPHLLAAMWVAFLVNLTAYPLTHGLLPYVARNIYHVDQTGLGYLLAGFALGALIGSVALTFAKRLFPLARLMIVSALLWYAMLLIFAHMPTALGGTLILILAGLAQSLSLVPLSVILLRTSDPALRGRVMGVRMLAIYGLPVGLLTAGALIERIGFYTALMTYGLIGVVCIIAIAVYWRSDIWPAHARANAA
jgi:MFS family permease